MIIRNNRIFQTKWGVNDFPLFIEIERINYDFCECIYFDNELSENSNGNIIKIPVAEVLENYIPLSLINGDIISIVSMGKVFGRLYLNSENFSSNNELLIVDKKNSIIKFAICNRILSNKKIGTVGNFDIYYDSDSKNLLFEGYDGIVSKEKGELLELDEVKFFSSNDSILKHMNVIESMLPFEYFDNTLFINRVVTKIQFEGEQEFLTITGFDKTKVYLSNGTKVTYNELLNLYTFVGNVMEWCGKSK